MLNNKYLEMFIEHLKNKDLSENTITNYSKDVEIFLNFINKNIEHIKDEDINKFTRSMKSASSINRRLVSLKEFFTLLIKKGIIIQNPLNEIEKVKIPKRLPKYLNIDESKKLLNSIEGEYKVRDYAIITLFLNCGLRLSELVNIDINNIKNDTLTVIGKGDKERTIYLTNSCKAAIEGYLKVRPQIHTNALFISKRKKRMCNRSVQFMIEGYLGKIGRPDLSTHKLRHTAATLMYKSGVDIKTLQEILGHEGIETTEIYMHVDNEQLRNAVNSNPLANIKI